MAAAEAAKGFWNNREFLTAWPATSLSHVRSVAIDEDVTRETVTSLHSLHQKLKQPDLWSEVAIVKRVIYQHGNQHRKQFYFVGLRKIVKSLNRLQEIDICDKWSIVRKSFSWSSRKRLVTDLQPPTSYPKFILIVDVLGCLTGAVHLILQVMSFCQETFRYSCSELVNGFFLTFHLACISSLSRVWVFLKDFMHTIAECYDVIFPWLNLLKDTQEIENSVTKDLPKSLKLWLQPLQVAPSDKMSNSTSLTPSAKTLTPGTLDKLFASTPREKPQDPSPRLLPTITDSLTEPSCDLGESFLSEEIHRPLKDSDALITDENSILKTKLFAKSPAELHKSDEEKTRITDNDSTRGKKRRAEVIDSDKDAKRTKKDKVKDKASGKDVTRKKKIKAKVIDSDKQVTRTNKADKRKEKDMDNGKDVKRTKKRKEKVLDSNKDVTRTKKAKKRKEKDMDSGKDAKRTKKRQAEVLDSELCNPTTNKQATELKRFLNRAVLCRHSCTTIHIFGKKTWRKKLTQRILKKKQKREEASRDEMCIKKKRKEICKVATDAKKKRKEEASRDSTDSRKKRKDETSLDSKHTKKKGKDISQVATHAKKSKEETGKDETDANKKRKLKTDKDETNSKKKRKDETSKDETDLLKKRKEETSRDTTHTKVKRTRRRGGKRIRKKQQQRRAECR